jgi:hypothetical protein
MTTYYLDPAADFVDRAGTDKVGAEYTGPGGMQAAIRGTGNATALAAGDSLVIKAGTMAIDRLVLLDCNGTDVSAWEVGDVVRNKDGAGDDWTGVVIQERDLDATGLAADDELLVQLDSSYTHADIDVADGVENTTKAESADPLASKAINPVYLDGTDGTNATPIQIIGCSADWTEKGATNGTIIDGSVGANTAANLWNVTGSNYWRLWNITFQNCSDDPMEASSNALYWNLSHCKFDSITGGTVPADTTRLFYATFYQCIFRNLSGYIRTSSSVHMELCLIEDCSGTYALDAGAASTIANCVFAGNTQEVRLVNYSTVRNCVVDGKDSGGSQQAADHLIDVSGNTSRIVGNRLVNAPAGKYAINAQGSLLEDYNVFYNPSATGDINGSPMSPGNSVDTATSGEDGMDGDWNVEDGKHHDSTAVVLNWDE